MRARARNASGYSTYSGAADAQTSPDRPFAPQPPEATARSANSISVSWDKPQHDGGSEILSYRLEVCRGEHVALLIPSIITSVLGCIGALFSDAEGVMLIPAISSQALGSC